VNPVSARVRPNVDSKLLGRADGDSGKAMGRQWLVCGRLPAAGSSGEAEQGRGNAEGAGGESGGENDKAGRHSMLCVGRIITNSNKKKVFFVF